MSELTFSEPDPSEPDIYKLPWPRSGQLYGALINVGHLGPLYDDNAMIDVIECDETMRGPLYDQDLRELCGEWSLRNEGQHLPIASGVYFVTLRWYFWDGTDWCTGAYDCEYGYEVVSVHRLRDLPLALIIDWQR